MATGSLPHHPAINLHIDNQDGLTAVIGLAHRDASVTILSCAQDTQGSLPPVQIGVTVPGSNTIAHCEHDELAAVLVEGVVALGVAGARDALLAVAVALEGQMQR